MLISVDIPEDVIRRIDKLISSSHKKSVTRPVWPFPKPNVVLGSLTPKEKIAYDAYLEQLKAYRERREARNKDLSKAPFKSRSAYVTDRLSAYLEQLEKEFV